ncbi:hypothetical protein MTR_2g049845 [Medicago truncatula]|uniref:Uncharacterized protein n=1 Tax=Medicago truncatula TaxID=3880 RepID=A0A072V7Z6_MEDTR|nr:hypothetical protein MTR_2g049845 [Medicago truncatula]
MRTGYSTGDKYKIDRRKLLLDRASHLSEQRQIGGHDFTGKTRHQSIGHVDMQLAGDRILRGSTGENAVVLGISVLGML